ncbi:hypothetical protein DIPPA_04521 [Diplonema papillatum]|nr:hypothetical protein DIPPA_04521 [Diplonema papillatum]|eukprot:gene17036-26138_t
MAKTREDFMREMGLDEADLQPPTVDNEEGPDDTVLRNTPLYDTTLLESLKAEQKLSSEGGTVVEGVEMSGNAYLRQELGRFREMRACAGSTQQSGSNEESSAGCTEELTPSDSPLAMVLTASPDYIMLGYEAGTATTYKQTMLDTFRKRKEQGLTEPACPVYLSPRSPGAGRPAASPRKPDEPPAAEPQAANEDAPDHEEGGSCSGANPEEFARQDGQEAPPTAAELADDQQQPQDSAPEGEPAS